MQYDLHCAAVHLNKDSDKSIRAAFSTQGTAKAKVVDEKKGNRDAMKFAMALSSMNK